MSLACLSHRFSSRGCRDADRFGRTQRQAVEARPTPGRAGCSEYAPSGRAYRGTQQEIGEMGRPVPASREARPITRRAPGVGAKARRAPEHGAGRRPKRPAEITQNPGARLPLGVSGDRRPGCIAVSGFECAAVHTHLRTTNPLSRSLRGDIS